MMDDFNTEKKSQFHFAINLLECSCGAFYVFREDLLRHIDEHIASDLQGSLFGDDEIRDCRVVFGEFENSRGI